MSARTARNGVIAIALCIAVKVTASDGLDPSRLLRPLTEEWTSYSGDYSGKRYSGLAQINQSNVKSLTLAWVGKMTGAPASAVPGQAGGRGGGFGPGAAVSTNLTIGGEGTGDVVVAGGLSIKGSILMVNGVLYV